MKNSKLVFVLSVVIALIIVAMPISIKCVFGNPVFDDVFGDGLCKIPVSRAGRVMPMSSAAADVLKSVSGKISVKIDGKKVSATEWLWLLNSSPEKMNFQKVLRTDNRDLQKLLKAEGRYVSYASVVENYKKLYDCAVAENPDAYSKSCEELLNAAVAYALASDCICVQFPEVKSRVQGIELWNKAVVEATKEITSARKQKREPDTSKLVLASNMLTILREDVSYEMQYKDVLVNAVFESASDSFSTPAQVLLEKKDNSNMIALAKVADALAKNQKISKVDFMQLCEGMQKSGKINFFRVSVENFVNASNPFFVGLILYAVAFVALLVSQKFDVLKISGSVFLISGVLVHSIAIVARMYIQMRPPVTNLYSSVVFTGVVAAALGVYMLWQKRAFLAGVSGAFVGMLSLVVAVNLPYSGDTMGMMRAVLNSNFWLTSHVVTIMIGYCGVFLAGFMASFRLVANAFAKGNFGLLTTQTAESVYAILKISLLFTFVGTMLGGVWADMSWGRFWGWDPKENGALMIVLWTAAVMHFRLLRVGNDRYFLALVSLGNVVTAWAWFGVNLLGIGLHSYGFISGGWLWFFIFIILQILVAPFAFLVYKSR